MNAFFYNQLVVSLLNVSELALANVSPTASTDARQEIVKHISESVSKDMIDIEEKVNFFVIRSLTF